MPNRKRTPLGARERRWFIPAVVTLSVVMFGLAIASAAADDSVFLWIVLYAPIFTPAIHAHVGFGPMLLILVLLGPVYHIAWSVLVFRGWRGHRTSRHLAAVVYCLHYGLMFTGLTVPAVSEGLGESLPLIVPGLLVFAGWQAVLVFGFLKGYWGIGAGGLGPQA